MKKIGRPTGPTVITQEQIDLIVDLRKQGLGIGAISYQAKVSREHVNYWVLATGTVSANDGFSKVRQPDCIRNGKPVRRFSDEEDALIQKLEREGRSRSEIARTVHRTHTSVRTRLQKLAIREAAQKATQDISAQ